MKYELEYEGKVHPVKFRHDRIIKLDVVQDEHGDAIITETLSATGGITTAYIMLEDETFINAVAKCSKKDIFSKHTGRMISIGRLKKRIQEEKELEEGTTY